jgi:glycosyltransferase involved in cell wall biosynthesis
VPAPRVVAAPYAVDNARIAALAARRRPDAAGRVRFLYVGRLLPRKGVDLLLDAYERVADDRTTLTILGDGPERAALMARQSPRAANRTQWLGKAPNAAALAAYADADVFVLPSRYEPWGLVVNEAMAAGLPVIADRRGGAARDLLAAPGCGVLLPEVSVGGLAAALAAYRDDPARAARDGAAAQARVQAWNFARTVDGFVAGFALGCPPRGAASAPREFAHA